MRTLKCIPSAGRRVTRRDFAKLVGWLCALSPLCRGQESEKPKDEPQFPVSLVKTRGRAAGIRTAVGLLGDQSLKGKDVYLKGNYTSADAFPATTHPDSLRAVVRLLRESACGRIFLSERSAMGSTVEIWDTLGIPSLAKELGLELMPLDALPHDAWRREVIPDSHWLQGVEVPRFLNQETCVVQLCNLKTHRFGGQFSASLKNSIGLVSKHSHSGSRHNYMEELHGSPDQRIMIAEVNRLYKPKLIVMDAMAVFVDGGPEAGESASADVILASRDRVALDAAGVALLRHLGAPSLTGDKVVFETEQIKRAAELKLGAKSGKEVCFVTSDSESSSLASQLKSILDELPLDEKN